MQQPEIRTMARPATRANYEELTTLAWDLFEMGIYADINLINGDRVTLTHAATDEQLRMTRTTKAPLADPITGHVIELSPVQTSVAGLTDAQTQDAYAEVTRRYALRAAARNRLDRATQYAAVLTAAHAGDWKRVNRLLGYAGVIE